MSAELINRAKLIIVAGKSSQSVPIEGVIVHFFNTNLIQWLSTGNKFKKLLILEKTDLVLINGIWTSHNFLFQKIAQHMGIKVIISPHWNVGTLYFKSSSN